MLASKVYLASLIFELVFSFRIWFIFTGFTMAMVNCSVYNHSTNQIITPWSIYFLFMPGLSVSLVTMIGCCYCFGSYVNKNKT